ncbi:aldo/keto reductase [Pengzhenrongella frigida]|uniref:Aldo/keto reductase n=1 Tax=Pengzhenrongella frigida TaxID=1259133 RepID=A0A4Q5MZC3_9MICO|nr:aldo/keto reductase [Cellulomonas sp. HLT2-17]RYV51085.1 aldo/keto reductase [Cellulomonas sp. HLT2-17]
MSTRLGIGLAAVGRPAYITAHRGPDLGANRTVEELERRTHVLLDAAYDAGLRYVDVARSYGNAEEFAAHWFASRGAVDVEVGSKWGYRYVGDWQLRADLHEVKDHSLGAFREQWPLTRDLLGDHLGRYLVHSATPDTGVLADTELHRELATLRDRGIRVGISTSGPRQADAIRTALDVEVDGAPLFTAFQVTWNPLEPSVGAAAAEADARGSQVVVKESVANGRLAPGGDDGSVGVRHVAVLASRAGVAIDQLAVAAALAQPWAWRVLSGAATPEHLASHVVAAGLVLDPELVEEVLTAAQDARDYWAERSTRPWT